MVINFFKKYALILSFFAVFTTFFAKSILILDPDFGWHYKAGELISQSGFPRGDVFSYTMPSYRFAYHEWLQDIFIYKAFSLAGSIPLALFYSLVGTLAIFFSGMGPVWGLLAGSSLLNIVRVNPQVASWLLFVLVLKITFGKSSFRKFVLLPPIFLIWANLHGGFIAGLLLVFLYSLFNWYLLPVAVLSLLISLVNPFGLGLWREIYLTLTDMSLKWNVSEWTPSIFWFDFGLYFLIVFSVILLVRYRKKAGHVESLIFGVFLLEALASARNAPYWLLFLPRLLTNLLAKIRREVGKIKYASMRLAKASKFLTLGAIIVFLVSFGVHSRSWALTGEEATYPKEAVVFLKNNLPEGELFSTYNWGGYLIWNLPEKKVFIDGRMVSWKNPKAPPNESSYAFGDYGKIVTGKVSFEEVFEKYNVDTVLWNIPAPAELKSGFLQKLFENKDTLVKRLKEAGWKEIYRDSVSLVLQSP